MFLKKGINWLDRHRISLQLRLAFFFTVSTAAVLFVVTLVLYHELQEQLELKDRMELMHTSSVLAGVVKSMAAETNFNTWRLTWKHTIKGHERMAVRIFSPNGEMYVVSPGMNIPSSEFPPPSESDFTMLEDEEHDTYYLLTSFTVETAPGHLWRVEAGYDTGPSYEMLEQYLESLLILLVLALITTTTISWLITIYGLQPLRRIGAAMHDISSENLSSRIGSQEWPSEIGSLAHSFDEMLERLEAAFAQLSRFSADLAHEVRTPVNNMLSAASVTLARKRNVEDYQNTLEAIINDGRHLERIVESMLFLARAENAKDELCMEQLSSAEEFQLQTDFFELLAEEKNISLHWDGEVTFLANPELLRRALSNLIDNAIRYTPEGGTVRLDGKESGHNVVITVSDSGIGIEAEHLPHIFERFYRADRARSKRTNSGLGLSLVQSIAVLHGGAVSVSSIPGQGSEFYITLPK
ncbi:heavy metal sensor histidine kinase [Maridesulfovibrio sp.]|uniref:heavy metal sensor histidine kinase n=1 Tax=Maridesulfovibrio sp. TaxID=2795000 RepID=UPI003BA8FAC5